MQAVKDNIFRDFFQIYYKMFLFLSFVVLTFYTGAQSYVGTRSLTQSMFLPPDPTVNPFYDPEIEYLVATLNNNTPNSGGGRTNCMNNSL
jgi:hypothetical protein